MTDWVYYVGIIFIILGALLIVLEFVHQGLFLLIPGIVLIVAGLLFLFFPDLVTETYWGATILVIVAIGSGLLTIPLYRRLAPVGPPMTTIPTSLTGETGLVISPVIPDSLSGKVRVRGEIWSARATIPIAAGSRVKVVGGEGVGVWVEPETTPTAPNATQTPTGS